MGRILVVSIPDLTPGGPRLVKCQPELVVQNRPNTLDTAADFGSWNGANRRRQPDRLSSSAVHGEPIVV